MHRNKIIQMLFQLSKVFVFMIFSFEQNFIESSFGFFFSFLISAEIEIIRNEMVVISAYAYALTEVRGTLCN